MSKQKGFTLVELLVVISIIALLMSILMPSLGKARQMARTVVCQTRIRQWGTILLMYAGDNNGRFNRGWEKFKGQGRDNISIEHDQTAEWMDALRSYSGDVPELGLCPEATKIKFPVGQSWTVGLTRSPWVAREPSPKTNKRDYGSYGMNAWLNNPSAGLVDLYCQDSGFPTENHWRSADVKGASNIPMFLDSWWIYAHVKSWDIVPLFEDIWPFGGGISRFCIDRHGNGILNCSFLDFSVRKIGIKELWTLKWHKKFPQDGFWTMAGGAMPSDWPTWMRNFKDY